MEHTTTQRSDMDYQPVYVAGNRTIHAGRPAGRYESGNVKYRKLCATSSRNERHWPSPAAGPITCKLCLAKMTNRPGRSLPVTNADGGSF